ncbi:hypothetical protein [Actinoplanes sp. URMC 104]|uniref:hypothetical protein n=1 Tax=Actinoplanes sp. URMC 104 TaxID=3423409 RepID=UPI003F1B70D9
MDHHVHVIAADEIAATNRLLRFDPDAAFTVEDEALACARTVLTRGTRIHEQWLPGFQAWRTVHPETGTSCRRRSPSGRAPSEAMSRSSRPSAPGTSATSTAPSSSPWSKGVRGSAAGSASDRKQGRTRAAETGIGAEPPAPRAL